MPHDVVIVGAGIVGLATAWQLTRLRPGAGIVVVDKESRVSYHQTGHNSGVIHSGIYYAPGSLKASTCRDGYRMLVEFAREERIPFEICGKLIVATYPEELPRLDRILERGQANGLEGLQVLDSNEIKEFEPHAEGLRAVRVPQAGIIDYTVVSQRLKERLVRQGVEFVFDCRIEGIQRIPGGFSLATSGNTLEARKVVTCGGLHSDRLARMTSKDSSVRIIPFRGEYYKLKIDREYLVKDLIYPVPDPDFPFLGVHFTRLVEGGREAGPNAVLAFKREGYCKSDIDLRDVWETFTWPGFHRVAAKYWRIGLGEFYRSFFKHAFVKALQRLVPEIQASDLEPGGAGVRAQASARDGGLIDDFHFVEDADIVHVCNAPSPAATASLAIGKAIAEKILAAS